jgi:hypothetical protein
MKKRKFTPFEIVEWLFERVGIPIEEIQTDKYVDKIQNALDLCPGIMRENACWVALTEGWNSYDYDYFYNEMTYKYEHFGELVETIAEVMDELENIGFTYGK